MKILFLYQYFGTPKGGWSTRVYELCIRWVEAGHKVTIITAPYDKSDTKANGFVSRQFVDGIELLVIDSGDSNKLSFLKRVLRAGLFSLVSSWFAVFEKKDVIIASSGPITIGIPALVGKFFSSKPLIFEVRDLWPDGAIEMGILKNKLAIKVAKWFERVCYIKSELVVPCSLGMDESIKKRFPQVQTLIIPNACDISLFKLREKKQFENLNKKYFLYAGSLGLMDSVDEIIDAVSVLKERDDFLVYIIGSGAEREQLESFSKKLGLDNKIFFLGLIPKEEVVSWFQNAYASFVLFKDFKVLSTSSPNKMFDSFAAKVPIIHNTKGWIKCLVDSSACGMSVLPKNPISMADAMEYLLDNPNMRDHMACNAFSLAEDEFNRDKLAIRYLKMVEELVS